MFRSIGAVLGGYLALGALNIFALLILSLYMPFKFSLSAPLDLPSTAWRVFFLFLQVVFSIAAGLVTSSIVSKKRTYHAWALAAIILLPGLANAVVYSAAYPAWYLFSLPFFGAAGALLGPKLKKLSEQHEPRNIPF